MGSSLRYGVGDHHSGPIVPDLAGDAMPALLKALKNEDCKVRVAAVNWITAVIQSSPDLTVDAIPALLEALKDEN